MNYIDATKCDDCGEHYAVPYKHVCLYSVDQGVNDGYFRLMRRGVVLMKRVRQFKSAVWRTREGAQAAADKLNAAAKSGGQ